MANRLGHCLHRMYYPVLTAGNVAFEGILRVGAVDATLVGLRVSAVGVHETERAFKKLEVALLLLERADRPSFERLKVAVSRIVIGPIRHKLHALFVLRSKNCYINGDRILSFSEVDIAVLLVHELTHARIEHAGVTHSPDRRMRIERRCVLQEIAFAQRLQASGICDMDQWIEHRVRNSLALAAGAEPLALRRE